MAQWLQFGTEKPGAVLTRVRFSRATRDFPRPDLEFVLQLTGGGDAGKQGLEFVLQLVSSNLRVCSPT